MSLYAFKDGLTVINQDNMNELLALQPFQLIYEGAADDSMSDAGTSELLLHSFYIAFSLTTGSGITTLSRIELDLASDGDGQDLTVQILDSDFNPDGSNEGTVLATVIVPKEFIPASQSLFSIPINLTGLTESTKYWVKVSKVGDVTNHNHLYTKGSEKDTAHKTYGRAGTSGAWSDASDSVRFKAYTGNAGVPIHEIYGTNGYTTIEYSSGQPSKVYFYLPPSDGPDGGIRNIMTMSYSSGILTGGSVT